LTREESGRARDIRAGEQAISIYDDLHGSNKTVVFGEITEIEERVAAKVLFHAPKRIFYNEADALEDQVLFPEEDPSKAPFLDTTGALARFESEGPSIARFVNDLDSDEELSDGGDGMTTRHDTVGDEDDSSDDTDDFDSDEDLTGEPVSLSEEMKEVFDLVKKWTLHTPRPEHSMDEDFEIFMDREKSKGKIANYLYYRRDTDRIPVFKEAFHMADLEPGAQEKYVEMTDMINRMIEYRRGVGGNVRGSRILDWMAVHPLEHPRVIRDMVHAVCTMDLFFPSGALFFLSEKGAEFINSALLNPAERAQTVLDRKTHDSNKCLPKKMWAEWDKLPHDKNYYPEICPFEWDKTIRPIIAKRKSSSPSIHIPTNQLFHPSIQRRHHLSLLLQPPHRHCHLSPRPYNPAPPPRPLHRLPPHYLRHSLPPKSKNHSLPLLPPHDHLLLLKGTQHGQILLPPSLVLPPLLPAYVRLRQARGVRVSGSHWQGVALEVHSEGYAVFGVQHP
jgi:hypothetical protein